jgi:general secretion pathway protein F
MVLFVYKGMKNGSKAVTGWIEAQSISEVKYRLGSNNIVVVECRKSSKQKEIVLTKKEIILLTEELSKLLKAGLPLYESLCVLEERYHKEKIAYLLFDICEKVKTGIPFSEALSFYPKSFDFLFCSMISNAEAIGSLEKTLDDLSQLMTRQLSLRKKVTAALIYPGMLAIFCVVIIFSLLFFVLPSLFELFEGKSVHPLTQFVLSASKIVNDHKVIFFSIILLVVTLVLLTILLPLAKRIFYRIFLKLPIVSDLMIKVAIVRFCRSFSTLLVGGVSYVQSLQLARSIMQHPFLEKAILEKEKVLIQGGKLSYLLKQIPAIPPLVTRMLFIAEESGATSSMLLHIASFYEEEIEKQLTRMTTLLQPLMLLILGVIVGLVVLSVLLPLTDVSSFIGG